MSKAARARLALIGDGHIAGWHAEALAGSADARVELVVGKEPAAAAAFAARHAVGRWTVDLDAALSDPDLDAAIVATPSEGHAPQALAALAAGKHVLVEAPMAMSAAAAEAMAAAAAARGLALGVCHPFRLRPELARIRERHRSGAAPIRLIAGQFLNRSRRAPVEADADPPAWTDNLLWHHLSHMLDYALWAVDAPVRTVAAAMGPLDARLGIPTEATLSATLDGGAIVVCSGSYWGRDLYDLSIVTAMDTHRFSQVDATFATGPARRPVAAAQAAFAEVPRQFVRSLREGGSPAVPGASVLPALRVLQAAQDSWDAQYGRQAIPGRPLDV